jgi:hypothetical protein
MPTLARLGTGLEHRGDLADDPVGLRHIRQRHERHNNIERRRPATADTSTAREELQTAESTNTELFSGAVLASRQLLVWIFNRPERRSAAAVLCWRRRA